LDAFEGIDRKVNKRIVINTNEKYFFMNKLIKYIYLKFKLNELSRNPQKNILKRRFLSYLYLT
ncbi:MAG: hypothetical protein ACP5LV_06365, partial [Thermoplasmata archaeon]